jgi:DNA invertase Pin-like site-specific DNA recombinase
VAVYTRVSTEDQAREGFSLAAQAKRLRSFANAQGWITPGEYVEDGYSGRNANRPAYQRMMAERETWDAILVLKMDRIHRNSRNFMGMMDDLRRWGKDFVSATESLDTATATGRFVADMLQRIAQLESEQTGERVHMGMKQAAEQGQFLGMSNPFGFTYSTERRNLVVVPGEAAVVRDIYRRHFEEGMSMQNIANAMNAAGVPTKFGKQWSKRQVFRILHCPLYEGTRHWDGVLTPNAHEPIVPPGPRRKKKKRRGRLRRRRAG